MVGVDRRMGAGASGPCSGMTLVEAMVASALSVFMFLILFNGIAFVCQLAADARYHNEAESLVMDQVLVMFNSSYTNLLSVAGVTTNTVPTNSMLFPLGGTMRTGVLVYSNYCQVQVRLDWRFIKWGGTNYPSESLWINRFPTLRGGL